MIELVIGNVGAGKTLTVVMQMFKDMGRIKTYSNIMTKKIKNNHLINKDMIIKKEIIKTVKDRETGDLKPVYKQVLNKEFWQNIKEPINVVIDEAHTILNSRRSMSKGNIIMTEWLAMIRRVLESRDQGSGTLYLISQLSGRLDIVARDMGCSVRFCRCHYVKRCLKCTYSWEECNDSADIKHVCPSCGSMRLKKTGHKIECYHFRNADMCNMWIWQGKRTYHKHYFIHNIDKYFSMYDTYQWDNLISD